MAHIVHQTILNDSSKDAVVQLYFESDGVSNDLVNQVLIDPTVPFSVYPYNNDNPNTTDYAFQPVVQKRQKLIVAKIWAELQDFSLTLAFQDANDSVVNQRIWSVGPYTRSALDFTYFGGIQDKTFPLDIATKIVGSTLGLSTPRSRGSVIVMVRKTYP